MASVYSKFGRWYLRYRDATGKWRHKASTALTKTEAKRLAHELDLKIERQVLGLEARPDPDGGGTVDELLTWWLKTYSAKRNEHAHYTNVRMIARYLRPSTLAALPLARVTSGHIETVLQGLVDQLSPESVNHVRSYLSRAFNAAARAGRYTGPNPVKDVKKRRGTKRAHDYLREHEVGPVLAALPPKWRPLFATAIYTGLRKGELLALAKTDVDLATRRLTVSKSHDSDTTKGGHADVIPIAAEAVPFLDAAIKASPSHLVFPGDDGDMRSRETPLEQVLRRAMKRAGIVIGYTHVCRKHGCGYAEQAPDAIVRWCSKHGHPVKLWPKANVRKLRFHDLRHTTASLLLMKGGNLAAVSKLLRHTDPKITMQIYGHLAPEYMTAEVDKLSFGAMPKPEEPARFVARLSPESEVGDDAADDEDEESCSDDDLEWSGQWDSNSRPPAPKAGALPD